MDRYIMIRLITISLICFAFVKNTAAQTSKKELRTRIFSADSVLLISHGDLRKNNGAGKSDTYLRIVKNNIPNKAIIKESAKLTNSSRDTLWHLLSKENTDKEIAEFLCFDPHHAILLFKNGKCTYIDICFDCRKFIVSTDTKISPSLSEDTWKQLKLFFTKRNID